MSSKLSTDTTAVLKLSFSVEPAGGQNTSFIKYTWQTRHFWSVVAGLLLCGLLRLQVLLLVLLKNFLHLKYIKVIILVHIELLTENKRFLSHLLQHNWIWIVFNWGRSLQKQCESSDIGEDTIQVQIQHNSITSSVLVFLEQLVRYQTHRKPALVEEASNSPTQGGS